jgi:CheY-like chemotaxis protein
MRAVLESQGAMVRAVGDTREALEALARERPDLLISDIGMPGTDGYILIREVRQLTHAQGGQTPAVAVSAYAGEENRRQALAAGYELYVAKPLEPSELIAVAQKAVGSRQ